MPYISNKDISWHYHRRPKPFFELACQARNYIRWRFSLTGALSRRKIAQWHGQYSGRNAVICCNGPSLRKVPFESLKSTFCFGLNKIFLLFEEVAWRPDVIVAVNGLVIEQSRQQFDKLDIPLFLSAFGKRHFGNRKNIHYLYSLPQPVFSLDPSVGVWEGYTVTVVALQLAHFFGFQNVALVGCDHSFAEKGSASKLVCNQGNDQNHFHANYFAGLPWQLPDIEGSEFAYRMCREAFASEGRSVFNCTDGGCLEVFERKSLSDFLKFGK
jgi:hypothetical protein